MIRRWLLFRHLHIIAELHLLIDVIPQGYKHKGGSNPDPQVRHQICYNMQALHQRNIKNIKQLRVNAAGGRKAAFPENAAADIDFNCPHIDYRRSDCFCL